jgi:hypothetical protein
MWGGVNARGANVSGVGAREKSKLAPIVRLSRRTAQVFCGGNRAGNTASASEQEILIWLRMIGGGAFWKGGCGRDDPTDTLCTYPTG